MPRHSKNNTASSVFTYHEAHKLEYGTKRQRLGRDSFRNYNACFLCLQTARDPVCCAEGHIACRECMYESILQQKEAIKLEQQQMEQRLQELNNKKQLQEEEARRALLDEFDKTQNSMLGNRRRGSVKVEEAKEKTEKNENDSISSNHSGKKRKFELTEDEIRSVAEKDIERTSLQLKEEKEEATKPKIASFWVPSLTPAADTSLLKPVKTQVMCHAAEKAHPLSIKSLIDVKFQAEGSDKDKNVCPACLKTITNAYKLSIMRSCGHVICNTCVDMFVKKSKKCYVCEKKVKSKDIVDMTPEGTGFASASSKAVAEKYTIAFQ
ncbi:hypothetical protein BCV72DRAFT_118746 [Rhizopus microsporus var. microsporus]|uniref:RING-type domain-containing protein n=1 Tax=Rhizopus microsporus var. microsporus TaxID=86635 RepID=A0A1X0R4B0_RHIZD|nr:hypothetical protein BCV72DRAFT_118746 [Rhizopus microsporus var. microsporus]